MALRYDYAVFLQDDTYVTNALLSVEEVSEMESRGYRLVRVRDTVDENLPRFRGRTYVKRPTPFGRRFGSR